jgi:DNA-binding MarR family transcriptional regulator
MQQLQDATNTTGVTGADETTPEACAALLMEVAPLVMRTIRAHMRGQRAADLSVPQFRVLGLIRRHPGASLSDAAEHVGLTPSAASRLVDGLVARGYVCRVPSPADRRAVALTLSPKGAALLEATHRATQELLAERLRALSPEERAALGSALATARELFAPSAPRTPGSPASAETAGAGHTGHPRVHASGNGVGSSSAGASEGVQG